MWRFIQSLIQKEVWFERFARKHVLMALCVALVLGLGGGYFLSDSGSSEEAPTEARIREVKVTSVAELSGQSSSLPLVGSVTSQSEASINAESSGEIVGVYRKLGDNVSPGTVIAEVENSRERAALAQAQAGLASAKASVSISEVGGDRDQKLLEEAKNSALNAIRSAYDTADDSIRVKLDAMFSNPRSSNPQFNIVVSDSQLPIDINFKRLVITDILRNESLREVKTAFEARLSELELPAGVAYSFGGENEEVDNSFRDMFLALIAGLVLMLSILVLEFNSFRYTLYLLSIVPLSLIGVLGGLALTGQTLSFPSMLGVIALAGVIINHGIILLDSMIHLLHREDKLDPMDVVIESASVRLRPIFLTTITTVIGMAPLTFASSLWGPLAFAIMFGLTFATILTLIFIPMMFYRHLSKQAVKQTVN